VEKAGVSLQWRITAVGCIAAACLVVLGGSASAGPAAQSRIVFAANRLPQSDGEIFRVLPSGKRLDLSGSPASDLAPAVSPDGRWLAFLSARNGTWAFYVVGTDGHGLRRISGALFPAVPNETLAGAAIAWAANSRSLAAELGGPTAATPLLYLGTRDGTMRAVARDLSGWTGSPAFAWSPDSRYLAYSDSLAGADVVSAAGKKLWSGIGSVGANAWSAEDRLAVSSNSSTVSIYNQSGRILTRFAGSSPVWSPNGKLLASLSAYAVQIRRDGSGAPIVRWPSRNQRPLEWIGSTKLRVFGATGWVGFDVAKKRAWKLNGPATFYTSAISTSGEAVGEQDSGSGAKLLLGKVGSAATTTLASGPFCPGNQDFAGVAFLPRGLGLIYQTNCITPPADIYSVSADGTGLRQLTRTPTDEMEPSLSPDGTNVVYVQELTAGRCDGCAQTLWRVPAAGGTPQQLTSYADTDAAPFDENPTWSPDAATIAFQNSGVTAPIRLLTIPASGGATTDLKVKAALPVWGPKLIAYADWTIPKLTVKTLDPASGTVKTVASGSKGIDAEALAWSPDGSRLAYLHDDTHGNAYVAIAGSTSKPLDLSAHLPAHARVAGLAWSPDGSRFAFAATDRNGIGEIYTIKTNGSDLRPLTSNIGALFNIGYESTISWR
jgi:Tol biopolymer transport system component